MVFYIEENRVEMYILEFVIVLNVNVVNILLLQIKVNI